MCSGFKPKARFYGLLGLKNRHFYAVPGTAGKSSSADKPRGSPKAPENSRIITTSIPHDFVMTNTVADSSGAFLQTHMNKLSGIRVDENAGTFQGVHIEFDLGRKNPIYSNSVSTVRVDALLGLNLIKAF